MSSFSTASCALSLSTSSWKAKKAQKGPIREKWRHGDGILKEQVIYWVLSLVFFLGAISDLLQNNCKAKCLGNVIM